MTTEHAVTPQAKLSANVPNAGTFILPYPTGESASSPWGSTGHILVDSNGNKYTSGFSFSFGAGGITVTNVSLGVLAAGRAFRLQLTKTGGEDEEVIVLAASDETTALTAAADKVSFRVPFAMTLSGVRAGLATAQSSGDILTVDIHKNGTTILSTKLTIDNGETTSATAAAPAVLSDTALDVDDEITVDIDQVGAAADAAGLKVSLFGERSA